MGRNGWHSAKMKWKFCLDWWTQLQPLKFEGRCLTSWCLQGFRCSCCFLGGGKGHPESLEWCFLLMVVRCFWFLNHQGFVGLGFLVGNNWALHSTGRANDSQWCNYWCRPLASRLRKNASSGINTPPKFKIAPAKWWLEDYLPFGNAYFHGLSLISGV